MHTEQRSSIIAGVVLISMQRAANSGARVSPLSSSISPFLRYFGAFVDLDAHGVASTAASLAYTGLQVSVIAVVINRQRKAAGNRFRDRECGMHLDRVAVMDAQILFPRCRRLALTRVTVIRILCTFRPSRHVTYFFPAPHTHPRAANPA